MKTMIILNENTTNNHAGEDYDIIFEVPIEITTENITQYVNRIKDHIRKLWNEDKEPKSVSITLDAHIALHGVLTNLKIRMPQEEGITITLPYADKLDKQWENVDGDALIKEALKRNELKMR